MIPTQDLAPELLSFLASSRTMAWMAPMPPAHPAVQATSRSSEPRAPSRPLLSPHGAITLTLGRAETEAVFS